MDGMVSIMQLTSLPVVIGAAIFLTYLAKYYLADVRGLNRLPTWIYTCVIAAVLTLVANRVTGTLPGNVGVLIVDAIINAAIASGLRAIVQGFRDKLGDSDTAQKKRDDAGAGSVSGKSWAWLLPLLLAGTLGLGAIGCASAGGLVTPAPTVDQVQAVRNQAGVLATATREAAALAVDARRLSQKAYEANAITAAQMQAINNAAIIASDKGLAFIDFAETVTTDPSLRVTASELLKVFDGYIASLNNAGQSGAAIRKALAAFIAYLGVQ